MNGMMEEAAKNMPHMMGSQAMGSQMMGPAQGAMMAATGYVAGRGLLGGLLRNPWVLLAAGVVAGYYLHKHQDEIMLSLSKASGMGKDFLLQQKENLADLVEGAKEKEAQQAAAEKPE
ncbi:MAG: hypothetical protein K8H75_16475 [Sulfuricella sp.]|nr:hypothetical protein [Sulfuricella sp.]